MGLKSKRLPPRYGEDNSDGSISLSDAYNYTKGGNDGKMDDMKEALSKTRKKPSPELLKEIDSASAYVRKSPLKSVPVAVVDVGPREEPKEEMALESAMAMGLPPIQEAGLATKKAQAQRGKKKLI